LSWRLLLETLIEARAYPLVLSLTPCAKRDLAIVTANGHCALDPHSLAELDRLLSVAQVARLKHLRRQASHKARIEKKRRRRIENESDGMTTDDEGDDDDDAVSDTLLSKLSNHHPTASMSTSGMTTMNPSCASSDVFENSGTTSSVKMVPTIAVRANIWTEVVSTISLSHQSNYHSVATIGGLPGGGPLGLSTIGPLFGNYSSTTAAKALNRKRGRHSPTFLSTFSSSTSSSSASTETTRSLAPFSIPPGRSRLYFVCPDEHKKTIVPGTVERVASDAISRQCGSTQRLLEDMNDSAYILKGQSAHFANEEQEHIAVIDYTYSMKEDKHWRELVDELKDLYRKHFDKEAKDFMLDVGVESTIICSDCNERLASLVCRNPSYKLCGKCCKCGMHVLTTHKGEFYEHGTGKPRPMTMMPSGFDLMHALKALALSRKRAKEAEVRQTVELKVSAVSSSKGRSGEVSAVSRKGHLVRNEAKDDRPETSVSSIYGLPFDLLEDISCFKVKRRRIHVDGNISGDSELDMDGSILESDFVDDLPMSTVSGLLSSKVYVKDAGLSFTTPASRSVKATYGENALWSTFYALLCSPIDLACETRDEAAAIRHPWVTSHPSGGFTSTSSSLLLRHIKNMEAIKGCEMEKIITDTTQSLFGVLLPRLRHDLFQLSSLEGIAHAGGGEAMSLVLTRLAKHYVSTFSGLPDIAVWDDPQTCPFCSEEHRHFHAKLAESSTSSKATVEKTKVVPRLALVEVKSSSDSLSKHQLEWIDYLNKSKTLKKLENEDVELEVKVLPAGVLHIIC
jgi:hypothetical protein